MEWNWNRIIVGVLAVLMALLLLPRPKTGGRALTKRQEIGYTDRTSYVERMR